ncbi:MAG: hypothetical protein AAF125_23790, partial [Chloroflexota bacterium]
ITSDGFTTVDRLLEFTLPLDAAAPTSGPAPGGDLVADVLFQVEGYLAFLPFEVDLSDPVQLAALIGAVIFIVLLLWLGTVILRLIFSNPPSYPNQPPPYANQQQLNPESLGGRRQMWQHATQHGSMLADEQEGNLHARKVLLGTDGRRFSGWRVVGIRASQYDNYGRITRTEVLGSKKDARRLTRAVERSEETQREQARRRVRPVATALAKSLARRISRKSATLPIALDIKFRGEHGEVGIQFLLYQYQLGAWRQLDSWNPEMTVTRKAIYETYTYTVFGKTEDEKWGAFRRRLRNDITLLLTEMVLCTPPKLETGIRSGNTTTNNAPVPTATPTRAGESWRAPTTNSTSPMPPVNEETMVGKPVRPEDSDGNTDETRTGYSPL